MSSMTACAKCNTPLAESDANLTANGAVCDLCMADAHEVDVAAGAMAKVKSLAIAAAVATAAGYMISVRSSSSSSFSSGGKTTSHTSLSADIPGLVGSGVGLLLVVAGIYFVATTKAVDEESAGSHRKQQLIYGLILLAIGAGAALRFMGALPSETSS